MKNRVLIIGQNPGNNPKAFSYKNHTIDKLNNWAKILNIPLYSFVNCIDSPGICKIKQVNFDFLKNCTKDHKKVIALGSFASTCLERINITHFKLPHSSPRNRMMNDKVKINSILEDCRKYINE